MGVFNVVRGRNWFSFHISVLPCQRNLISHSKANNFSYLFQFYHPLVMNRVAGLKRYLLVCSKRICTDLFFVDNQGEYHNNRINYVVTFLVLTNGFSPPGRKTRGSRRSSSQQHSTARPSCIWTHAISWPTRRLYQ